MIFLTFIILSLIFDWIIKKTGYQNKLLEKCQNNKYFKILFILLLVLFSFSFEYGKQVMNEKYGHNNYLSIVIGAFLVAIYFNFVPIIFKKNKSK